MRRGVTSTVVVAVVAALAAIGLLIWGSTSGDSLVGPPQGSWEPPGITMPPVEEQQPPTEVAPDQGEDLGEDAAAAIDWLLVGFGLLVATALLIVARLLARRRARDPQALGTEEDEELAALLEATGEQVRYRALSETDPRNAVVACWVALEDAVQHSGLRRDPTETATELATRVLGHWNVDAAAVEQLCAAYREARFSRHPVTELERDRAIAALQRIHEDLRQRVLEEQIRAAESAQEQAPDQSDATTSSHRAER